MYSYHFCNLVLYIEMVYPKYLNKSKILPKIQLDYILESLYI
jgi:hypothetical protein